MHRFYKEKPIEQGQEIILNDGLESVRESFLFGLKQKKKQYLKTKKFYMQTSHSDAIHL
jgi:hypothetical protein